MTLFADPAGNRAAQDPPQDFDHAPPVMKAAFAFWGLIIMLLGAGVIPANPASFHAPHWVVFAMGMLFFLVAVLMFIGRHRLLHPAVYMAVAATMASSLAAVFCWGAGWFEGPFSPFIGVGPVFVNVGSAAGGLSRLIVGALALLAIYISVQGWLRWWRALRGRPVELGS